MVSAESRRAPCTASARAGWHTIAVRDEYVRATGGLSRAHPVHDNFARLAYGKGTRVIHIAPDDRRAIVSARTHTGTRALAASFRLVHACRALTVLSCRRRCLLAVALARARGPFIFTLDYIRRCVGSRARKLL